MGLDIKNKVEEKLNNFNMLPLERQKDNVKDNLIKIEEAVQKINEEREDLIKEYKSKKINPFNIAQVADIARQTVYNNKALKEYINNCREQQKQNDIFETINFLKAKIEELEKELYLLYQRDAVQEKQAVEIDRLKEIIEEDAKIKENLKVRNKKLIDKNKNLKEKLDKKENNLIEFNKKKDSK